MGFLMLVVCPVALILGCYQFVLPNIPANHPFAKVLRVPVAMIPALPSTPTNVREFLVEVGGGNAPAIVAVTLVVLAASLFYWAVSSRKRFAVLNMKSKVEYEKEGKEQTRKAVMELMKSPEYKQMRQRKGTDPKNWNWQKRREAGETDSDVDPYLSDPEGSDVDMDVDTE